MIFFFFVILYSNFVMNTLEKIPGAATASICFVGVSGFHVLGFLYLVLRSKQSWVSFCSYFCGQKFDFFFSEVSCIFLEISCFVIVWYKILR
jgi:hypothetical protein